MGTVGTLSGRVWTAHEVRIECANILRTARNDMRSYNRSFGLKWGAYALGRLVSDLPNELTKAPLDCVCAIERMKTA